MVTLTLLDIDEAGPALEKLVSTRLGPKALLRVTRYSKWAFAQGPAIRAAKEALARELGEADPNNHGSWHIPAGQVKREFNNRLREALLEPATIPADLQKINSGDLLAAAPRTPAEIASIWFMIADWEVEDAPPAPEISSALVAAGGNTLAALANNPNFEPDAAMNIARWLRSLGPALQMTRTLVSDAGFLFGETDGAQFKIPAEKNAEYCEMISKGLEGPAPLRPPFPAPIPAAAFENAMLTPRELMAVDWMIDWTESDTPDTSDTPPPSPECKRE